MKDYAAFEKQEGVCYIPESEDSVYYYSDLMSICGNNTVLVNNMFDQLDCQHPETLFEEWLMEGEIDEFGNILNQE